VALKANRHLVQIIFISFAGHEEVWHGFIDIVFSPREGIPLIVNTVADLDTDTLTADLDSEKQEIDMESPLKRRKTENCESLTLYVSKC
jgi:hypothetical protein